LNKASYSFFLNSSSRVRRSPSSRFAAAAF
jgi:hypothetical protein